MIFQYDPQEVPLRIMSGPLPSSILEAISRAVATLQAERTDKRLDKENIIFSKVT